MQTIVWKLDFKCNGKTVKRGLSFLEVSLALYGGKNLRKGRVEVGERVWVIVGIQELHDEGLDFGGCGTENSVCTYRV